MTDLAAPAPRSLEDVQSGRPRTSIALARTGVTGVEKVFRLGPDGAERALFATFECSVDLGATQRGAHMSRFDEAVEAIALEPVDSVDALAARLAERVRELHAARWAEVWVRARMPQVREAPASGAAGEEMRTVLAAAVAVAGSTRRLLGVDTQGMTACPCGQAMATAAARERLADEGFDDEEIERVLASVPVATHNQRGLATLWVGPHDDFGAGGAVAPEELIEIAELSMSSPIWELLKRPDEAHVVERAHRRARFVEDCVREMLSMGVERLGRLGARTYLSARQENLETIHRHKVVAERAGLLGELGEELAGGAPAGASPSPGDWLRSA
jgi:GTP cyclohydrolase IV